MELTEAHIGKVAICNNWGISLRRIDRLTPKKFRGKHLGGSGGYGSSDLVDMSCVIGIAETIEDAQVRVNSADFVRKSYNERIRPLQAEVYKLEAERRERMEAAYAGTP